MSTKALAKQLGKIRSRVFASSSTSSGSNSGNDSAKAQKFKYLFILDFESTCWETRGFAPPEIIEFPCILLETASGKCLQEFRSYVCPIEHPNLSAFCTNLTGISQGTLDLSGVPIGTALYLFKKWIAELTARYSLSFLPSSGCTAAFLTWSSWDLGVCLKGELLRKQIPYPTFFHAWIDIRHVYSRFYARSPQGLHGALKDLGLNFEGREHSGLDDAKNTARLVAKMIADGCCIGITKTLPGVHVPDAYKFSEEALDPGMKKAPKNLLKKTLKRSSNGFPCPKQTPPLCSCGRRAKFLSVSKIGPNQGRSFFACVLRKCGFFSWAHGGPDSIAPHQPPATHSKTLIETTTVLVTKEREKEAIPTVKMGGNYFGNVPIMNPVVNKINRFCKRTLGLKRRSL